MLKGGFAHIYIYIYIYLYIYINCQFTLNIDTKKRFRISSWHYLIRFTLSRAGAHCIHPQVGVHVIGADPGVWIGDMWHNFDLVLHPHCHTRQEPDPPWKQHPPHLQSGTLISKWWSFLFFSFFLSFFFFFFKKVGYFCAPAVRLHFSRYDYR